MEAREEIDIEDHEALRKAYPRAYDDGLNRGHKYYDDCVPRERFSFRSRYTEFYEKLAFRAGMFDGYEDAEKTDYRINDFPIDDE